MAGKTDKTVRQDLDSIKKMDKLEVWLDIYKPICTNNSLKIINKKQQGIAK